MSQPTLLMTTQNMTGMPVVSSQNGQQLGKVSDVVLDPKKKSISAFLLNSDNPQQAQAVPFKEVSEIVSNTVFVKDSQVIKPAAEVVKFEQQSGQPGKFVAQKVVDNKGKELGKISDLYFDPTKGKVEQIEYRTGNNGEQKKVRMKVKKIEFKQDIVEVKPEKQQSSQEKGNPVSKAIDSIKEKLT